MFKKKDLSQVGDIRNKRHSENRYTRKITYNIAFKNGVKDTFSFPIEVSLGYFTFSKTWQTLPLINDQGVEYVMDEIFSIELQRKKLIEIHKIISFEEYRDTGYNNGNHWYKNREEIEILKPTPENLEKYPEGRV